MSVIDLGTIIAGQPSKLKVNAVAPDGSALFIRLKRNKDAGELPQGLKIEQDGSITGVTTFRNITSFDKGTTTFSVTDSKLETITTWDSSFVFTAEAYSDIGPLQSISIIDGGSGYDPYNPPIVIIGGGGGIQATAEAIVDGTVLGEILEVHNYGPADSLRAAGTYSGITGPSSGAGTPGTYNITVDSNGAITDVTIVTRGSGNAVNDTITISDSDLGGPYGGIDRITQNYPANDGHPSRTPGTYPSDDYTILTGTTSGSGTVGTFEVRISSDTLARGQNSGTIDYIKILDPGYGHEIGDVITISDSDLGGPANGIATVDTFSAPDPLRVAGPYTDVTGTSSGSGTVGTFDIVVDGVGAITSVTPIIPGRGHAVNDTITIADADLGAGGAADFTMDVATLSNAPDIEFTIDSITQASDFTMDIKKVISSIANPGQVSGVTITNPGEGFTYQPTITFTGGGGSGALASADIPGGFGIRSVQDYSVTVSSLKAKPWQNLYCIALPHAKDRSGWQDFTSDFNIFDQDALYRKNDERFGLQRDIRILVKSGLNPKYLEDYMFQMEAYHYTKTLRLGDLKSARSYVDGKVEYEIIYYEVEDKASEEAIIDLSETDFDFAPVYADTGKVRASLGDNPGIADYSADMTTWSAAYDVFPNSFYNMRNKLTSQIGEVVSEAKSLPSWMSTEQADGSILQYKTVVPLAYVKPGEAERIKFLIRRSKFNPNNFLFQVDRYEWDRDLSLSYDIDVDRFASRVYTTYDGSTTTFDEEDMRYLDVTQTITGNGTSTTFNLNHYIDRSNEVAIFGDNANVGTTGKLTPVKDYVSQFKSITFNFTPLNNDKYYVVFTEYAPQTYHKVGEKDKYIKFPQTGVYE